MAVSESERKIDKLKKDNEELRGRLHELQIDVTSDNGNNKAGQGSQMMDEEIIELNSNLNGVKKDYQTLQEKFKRINIVNDQISGWARRCFTKFSSLIDNGRLQGQAQNLDIVRVFEGMNMCVCDELRRLAERQAQEDGTDAIEYGDVFTDIATEDFISKNIRVRPVSGITHADETKDGRQSNVSRAQRDTEGNEDGEDNYNKYAQLELEDQRKLIKTKHRDALEEIKRKQMLAQKEAEAKKKQ